MSWFNHTDDLTPYFQRNRLPLAQRVKDIGDERIDTLVDTPGVPDTLTPAS